MKKKLLIITGVIFLVFGVAYASWHYDSFFIRPNSDQAKTFVVQDADAVEVFSVNTSTAGVVVTGTQSVSGITTQTGALNVAGATTLSSTLNTVGVADFAARVNIGTGFWDDCPSIANNDPSTAFFYFEDFIGVDFDSAGITVGGAQVGAVITTVDATLSGWNHLGDTGWTIVPTVLVRGGQITISCHTDAEDELYFGLGEIGTEVFVDITKSSGKEMWLEYRMSVADTTAVGSFFIGLADSAAVVANFIAEAGNDIADVDVLGFISWEGAPNTVGAFYQTEGTAFVDTFDTEFNIGESMMTYGMHFDGDSTVNCYIDGSSIGSLLITQSLFPDAQDLTPMIAVKQGTGDRVLTFDWIKLVAER